MLVFDFESQAIQGNPTVRPPEPVGLAYKRPGSVGRYLGWGHPTSRRREANYAAAKRLLGEAVANGEPVLCHNAKYDQSLAHGHFGEEFVHTDPLLVHDSMFQIFLHDPYANSFSLKPSAERILGTRPEEQDHLRDWIVAHVEGATKSNFGAYIALAPEDIVAPYAIGDVDRTLALHEHLHDKVPQEAYKREQLLLPLVMESERAGIRCNTELMVEDLATYEGTLERVEAALRKSLKMTASMKMSGEDLADALEASGKIGHWVKTPTGKRSVSRDNLEKAIADRPFLTLLKYHNALSHYLSNFGRVWTELALAYNGRVHPEWNQVRQYSTDKKSKGTRTGRLSGSKPNFMNVPNEYVLDIPKGMPALPIMRQYLLPDEGYVWCKRDYSQQELRILAHYSEGRLFGRYKDNPKIDAHEETGKLITEHTGLELPRKAIKIVGFSMIYGSGIPALAEELGVGKDEAAAIKDAYLRALPEVKTLMDGCKTVGRTGQAIATWGGRDYYVEPPMIKDGRRWTFEYKLLNYLIQGSAADCTKEALVRWNADRGAGKFLVTVHDEINIQVPKQGWKVGMSLLKNAMESVEFDVKMLSDGFVGPSWSTLKECA